MLTLQDLIDEKIAKYGKTVPSQLNPNLNTIERVEMVQRERDWDKAKRKLISKKPIMWFDEILNEWLKSGKQGTHNLSELKHWYFLKDFDDHYEISKMYPLDGKYLLTVFMYKGDKEPKSYLRLEDRELGKAYAFPDWDSIRARAEEEKKQLFQPKTKKAENDI